jgi:hypothetical protein
MFNIPQSEVARQALFVSSQGIDSMPTFIRTCSGANEVRVGMQRFLNLFLDGPSHFL